MFNADVWLAGDDWTSVLNWTLWTMLAINNWGFEWFLEILIVLAKNKRVIIIM